MGENLRLIEDKVVLIGEKHSRESWDIYWGKIKESYNVFEGYEIIIGNYLLYNLGYEQVCKHLGKSRKTIRILDAGCGPGKIGRKIDEVGFTAVGLDWSEKAIEKYKSYGLEGHVGDIEKLPFEDNSFDAYLSIGNLAYFPDFTIQLKEAIRVVKPFGAILLFTVIESVILNNMKRNLKPLEDGEIPTLYFHRQEEISPFLFDNGVSVISEIPTVVKSPWKDSSYSIIHAGGYYSIDRVALFIVGLKRLL